MPYFNAGLLSRYFSWFNTCCMDHSILECWHTLDVCLTEVHVFMCSPSRLTAGSSICSVESTESIEEDSAGICESMTDPTD